MNRRTKDSAGTVVQNNLLGDLPDARHGELTETLLAAKGVRCERIISHGQASLADFWYDQGEAEWVLLLSGSAGLMIEGEPTARVLSQGEAVFLPSGCRHRVDWTDPDQPTVWLALFIDNDLEPTAQDRETKTGPA